MCRLGHFITTFTLCAGTICRFIVKAGGKGLICAAAGNSSLTVIPNNVLLTIMGYHIPKAGLGGGGANT
jgi:hypothetical protein